MKILMPQEIEVWYVLPALRKKLAQVLIADHKLTQKNVAALLGMTEAAISQYIKGKRGEDIDFSQEEEEEVKATAQKMLADKENAMKYLYELCVYFRGTTFMCKLHKQHDATLPEGCDVCMKK